MDLPSGVDSRAKRISMNTPTPPSKRVLLFDRRYGWIFDEWKEPSQEALSGGRGMFCIVPLAKAVLEKAPESMNSVANATLKGLDLEKGHPSNE